MQEDFKQAIVVRADIKMSAGKIAAQCCHASLEAYKIAKKRKPALVKKWEMQGSKKVVLKADSLEELLALAETARKFSLSFSRIADAGLTEIPEGTVTAIAVGPAASKDVDRVTGKLETL